MDDVERAEVVERAADLGRDEPDLLLVQVARVAQVEPVSGWRMDDSYDSHKSR